MEEEMVVVSVQMKVREEEKFVKEILFVWLVYDYYQFVDEIFDFF